MACALAALLLAGSPPAQAADNGSLSVSAVVLSRSVCRFLTGTRTLDFGTIDPTSAVNATASVTVQFWCLGYRGPTTYAMTANNGLHAAGAGLRRLRHTTAATEYMAYSLALSPASGTLPWLAAQTVTVSGTIVPTEFQNARFGAYSDTVVLSVNP